MKRPAFYTASQHVNPRVLMRGAQRLWAYYRDTPTASPALCAVWEITNACDADCSFCGTHVLRKRFGERSRDEVLRIADALTRAGIGYVNLTGGEPLVAKHLFTAMDRLLQGGVKVMVNSNGSRVAALASELVGRISVLTISLDSLDPATHDRVRQQPGLTNLIHEGIAAIRAQPGSDTVSVRIRSIVSPENFRDMVAFAKAMRPNVDEVCFQPMQDGGDDDIHRGDAVFSPDLEPEFRAVIDELIGRFPEYDTFYYRRMADFLFQPARVRDDFHCILPALLFRCLSNGDVVLCSNATAVTGNLLTQEVSEVFNHPAFDALRSASRHRCRSCLCWVQPLRMNQLVPSWAPRVIPARRR